MPIRRRWVRTLSTIAALVLVLLTSPSASPASAAPPASPTPAAIVQDEAYWISLAQIPPGHGVAAGAICEYAIQNPQAPCHISPHDGNIAALGMLAAGPRYYPMVKAWILWYFSHLNWPDYLNIYGTVYDYTDTPATGTESIVVNPDTGLPNYDSNDGYAGTFLSLVRAYAHDNPGDDGFLRAHGYAMDVIANALWATKAPDGLTWARLDWHGEYLLDNIEAAQGLADYSWLLTNVLGEPGPASYWGSAGAEIRQAVEQLMWFPAKGMYGWASDQPDPSWTTFYPDSVVQAWPIIYGYGSAAQRSALWTSFNQSWPGWVTTADNPGTPLEQPWSVLGYVAALLGQKQQVQEFLDGSETKWVDAGRPFPWAVDDSAYRALTAEIATG